MQRAKRSAPVIAARGNPNLRSTRAPSFGGWLIAIYILTTPLAMFAWGGAGSLHRYSSVVVVGVAIAYLLSGRIAAVRLPISTVWWLLYGIWTLASVMWSSRPGIGATTALGMIFLISVLVILAHLPLNHQDEHLVMGAWMVVGVICAVLFFAKNQRMAIGERAEVVLASGAVDPNEFCAYFMIPLAILTRRTLSGGGLRRLLSGAPVLGIFYIILATGSRGGLLAAGCVVFTVALWSTKVRIGVGRFLRFGLLSILAWWLLSRYVLPQLPPLVLKRFSLDAALMDGGSGRTQIWVLAVDRLLSDGWRFLVGYGPLGAPVARPVVHNHYLQALVDGGLIGFVLLVILLAVALRDSKLCGQVIFAAIVGTLVTFGTLTAYSNYRPAWLMLGMTLIFHQFAAAKKFPAPRGNRLEGTDSR